MFPTPTYPRMRKVLNISGTELRDRLNNGREIPSWFTYPEVAKELRKSYPPRAQAGRDDFLYRTFRLRKIHHRQHPDDQVPGNRRTSGHDFSTEIWSARTFPRNSASPKNTATSTSAASAMSPQRSPRMAGLQFALPSLLMTPSRKSVRQAIEPHGGFILVHISTPIETCESRDRKGLYAKARAGIVKEFTEFPIRTKNPRMRKSPSTLPN